MQLLPDQPLACDVLHPGVALQDQERVLDDQIRAMAGAIQARSHGPGLDLGPAQPSPPTGPLARYMTARPCRGAAGLCCRVRVRQAITENPLNRPRLFVTDEDVTGLPCFANDTLFAVKAPPGTTLEVPDPRQEPDAGGEHMRYRCGGHGAVRMHALGTGRRRGCHGAEACMARVQGLCCSRYRAV